VATVTPVIDVINARIGDAVDGDDDGACSGCDDDGVGGVAADR